MTTASGKNDDVLGPFHIFLDFPGSGSKALSPCNLCGGLDQILDHDISPSDLMTGFARFSRNDRQKAQVFHCQGCL